MNGLEALTHRGLPDILTAADGEPVVTQADWACRRREIRDILCREEYGFLPPPVKTDYEVLESDDGFCAGSVLLEKVRLTVRLPQGAFSFPVCCARPKGKVCPAFILVNFRDDVPDRYFPAEEICDHGFAVISFGYEDVTRDDADFSDGLAGVLYRGSARKADDPGKIALWAWAAMRVMDYAQTLEGVDHGNIAVVGHSRLGKTALLAGALDERFAFVFSNDSGCSGAAVSRGKCGETVGDIVAHFPYWFCENYRRYAGNETGMPFDQHFLLSLAAPRHLYVASAAEDRWADPVSEYLGCIAADRVYRFLGRAGFDSPPRLPETGDSFHHGRIGYHLRSGRHYLSRCDWLQFMEYMRAHRNT